MKKVLVSGAGGFGDTRCEGLRRSVIMRLDFASKASTHTSAAAPSGMDT